MKPLYTLLICILPFFSYSQDWDVAQVKNSIKVGSLVGNKKLEFGVKNIIDEVLQDRNLSISTNATNKVYVEIIYMDILYNKSNLSLFHKDNNETIIRIKGYVVKDGAKSKDIVVEGVASEVSVSTLLIADNGKLSQSNLSSAIKKACQELIEKLTK